MPKTVSVRVHGAWDPKIDNYSFYHAVYDDIPIYHWSPSSNRDSILSEGLVPRHTSNSDVDFVASYCCFADTPSWAWGLSGGMGWMSDGEYDLWQTELSQLGDPLVYPTTERPSGIYEVRNPIVLGPTSVWYVGSREKKTID